MSTRLEIAIAVVVVVVLLLAVAATVLRRRPAAGADADRFHHLQHMTNAWSAGHDGAAPPAAAEPAAVDLTDEQSASLGYSAIRGEPAKIHLTSGPG